MHSINCSISKLILILIASLLKIHIYVKAIKELNKTDSGCSVSFKNILTYIISSSNENLCKHTVQETSKMCRPSQMFPY